MHKILTVSVFFLLGLMVYSSSAKAQDKSKKPDTPKKPDLVKKPIKEICNALPGKWRVLKVIRNVSSTTIPEEGTKQKGPGVALKLTDKVKADPEKDYSAVIYLIPVDFPDVPEKVLVEDEKGQTPQLIAESEVIRVYISGEKADALKPVIKKALTVEKKKAPEAK
jgi:hypothetical protein